MNGIIDSRLPTTPRLRRAGRWNDKMKGFTLIEVVIVILVLGVLIAAGALFAWPGKGAVVMSQGEQLAGDLRYARHYAVAHEASTQVVFNTAAKTYTLTLVNGGAAVVFPGQSSNTVTLDADFSLSLTNLPNNLVIFGDNGEPYSAAGSLLTSDAVVTVSGDGKNAATTIKGRSGTIIGP